MRRMSRVWIGSTIALAVTALFLTGCPKRPEVVETVPPPGAQQGQAGVPVIQLAPKPATPTEKSPTEVAVQAPEARLGETGAVPEVKIAETEVRHDASAAAQASELKDIYFDFDQSAIREDSKQLLHGNVEWFKQNAAAKVIIEGHCDERGSSEYNLALGQRRAKSTRDYLVAGGVPANQISTISYGKERPFVQGHDESAWRWNRRAHFVRQAK